MQVIMMSIANLVYKIVRVGHLLYEKVKKWNSTLW